MSFLGLEGLHVFITGAAGPIGGHAVKEFLEKGCKVTAYDTRPPTNVPRSPKLFVIAGDISSESSIKSSMVRAKEKYGPINILIANAGLLDEPSSAPIWKIPVELWESTYNDNIRNTFLTIKHFLLSAEETQAFIGQEIENLAIVVTGSETGVNTLGLQCGLIRRLKTEIRRLNSKARINIVSPGWVDASVAKGGINDINQTPNEIQATMPLRMLAQPYDVARAMSFIASHRVASQMSGETLTLDGGSSEELLSQSTSPLKPDLSSITASIMSKVQSILPTSISTSLNHPSSFSLTSRKIRILIGIDFDAISGFLGTGTSPTNDMATYSTGFFAGQVGVPRLLRLFKKHGISSKVTWFIPGHSMETFPKETKMIVDSGAEIACHGYAHEGGAQMTEQQEEDVIKKCVKLATALTGKKPKGWRAPLYQLREHTVKVLEKQGFLYDSSLNHHDSAPYYLPRHSVITPIDFSPCLPAASWMHPTPSLPPLSSTTLVEIPANWYMEDMTPMQYLPAAPNSHGFVSANAVMEMWKERFEFLYSDCGDEESEQDVAGDEKAKKETGFIYPLVLHPDTSGMAHVIGMIDRMISWLKSQGKEVEFCRYEDVALEFKKKAKI
ncbi:hypothetical protein B7494_g2334 [Chlorociboria aeruginascens]|nr:hypothetical protein B7494_g2334 [Chlorociboria aeruginascens]